MATSTEADSTDGASWTPETLGPLFHATERKHDRAFLIKSALAGTPVEMPDWRFHRHVIRIGLYLHERLQVSIGDRVAVVAPIGPEWAIAQWAALTQGVSVAALDPGAAANTLAEQLAALGPRVVFAEGPALEAVLAWSAGTNVIVIAVSGVAVAPSVSWTEALDLGGTLDTAERANAYRGIMRALPPETAALAHTGGNGVGTVWRFLTHRDVVRKIQRIWEGARISQGDVAYIAGGAPSLFATLAFLAFSADGHTQVLFGTRGHEVEEIRAADPTKIVVPAGVARDLTHAIPGIDTSRLLGRASRWLAQARAFAGRARRSDARSESKSDQPRARWLGTGGSLDASTRDRLSRSMIVDLDGPDGGIEAATRSG
jgi:hypothetical protein